MGALTGEIIAQAIKFIVDAGFKWTEFEHRTYTTLRGVGYVGEQLKDINSRLLADTTKLAVTYGVTHDKVVETLATYTKLTKTAAILNSTTLETQVALGKLVGDSNVANWEQSMYKFGMHAKAAQTWLGKATIESKKMGLNVEAFTEALAKNASLMQSMTFSTGISGLQKMTALATRLGGDLASLSKSIDIDSGAFSTIESAIEASAKIQRLGGAAAAQFSNPLEMFGLAYTDAEGYMEKLEKSLEGKAVFNRETGQATLSPLEQKRIGLQAEAMGLDKAELRTAAMRVAMGKALESDMRNAGVLSQFSKTEVDAIKNLAQFDPDKNGWFVTDAQGKNIDINQLTPQKLAEVIKLSKEEKTLDQNVKGIAGDTKKIADVIAGRAKETTSTKEVYDGSHQAADVLKARAYDWSLGGVTNWLKDKWQSIFGHENGGIIQPSPTGLEGVQKFATGGLVGGTSTTGDRVLTRLNSGEMVLNPRQQARLFELANSSYTVSFTKNAAQAKYLSKSMIAAGEAIERSAIMTNNTFRLLPQTTKEFQNVFKLAKSTLLAFGEGNYLTGIPLSGLFSDRNLMGRYLRSQLYQISPQAARAVGTVSKYYSGVRNAVLHPVKTVRKVAGATGRGIASAWNWLGNTKLGQGVASVGRKIGQTKLGQSALRAGRNVALDARLGWEFLKTSKTLSNAASKFSEGVSFFGKKTKDFTTGVSEFAKKTSGRVASFAKDKGGKLLSRASKAVGGAKGIAKVGKSALKLGGKLFPGIVAATGVMDIASNINQFSTTKEAIESRTDLSRKEKREILRKEEDKRNENVGAAAGAAIGAFAGKAVSYAAAAIPIVGPAISGALQLTGLDSAIGSWVGKKVGGFVGKHYNKAKEFLFGKKPELSEEEEAQKELEETKIGQVDISDPQLQEKANMAICGMHDLLISIYYHMTGRAHNGEEIKKGVFGNITQGLGNIFKLTPFGLASSAIGSIFGGKSSEGKGKPDVKSDTDNTDVARPLVTENVNINAEKAVINANLSSDEDGSESKLKSNMSGGISFIGTQKALEPLAAFVDSRIALVANKTIGVIDSNLTAQKEENTNIVPKPLGEDAVRLNNTTSENSTNNTQQPAVHTPETIKLEISGTLRLEGGGTSTNVDINSILRDPISKQALVDAIVERLNSRNNSGLLNKNNRDALMRTTSRSY